MKKILLIITILLSSTQVYSAEHSAEQVEFMSRGDKLSGTIVFPSNGKIHSAVVFVHGSGKQTRNIYLA